jgi:hypothetical protein
MMYKTRVLMDYIHHPVSSIDHDVSETASLRNVVIYRRSRTMDIVHKHSSSVHILPPYSRQISTCERQTEVIPPNIVSLILTSIRN